MRTIYQLVQDFFHPQYVMRHAQLCLVFPTQLEALGLDRQDEVGRMASGGKRARTNRGLVDGAPIPEARTATPSAFCPLDLEN